MNRLSLFLWFIWIASGKKSKRATKESKWTKARASVIFRRRCVCCSSFSLSASLSPSLIALSRPPQRAASCAHDDDDDDGGGGFSLSLPPRPRSTRACPRSRRESRSQRWRTLRPARVPGGRGAPSVPCRSAAGGRSSGRRRGQPQPFPSTEKKGGRFRNKGRERRERKKKREREKEARERKRRPPPPRPPTTTNETHLRAPPDAARDGEDDSKHRQGDAHGPQADARVEVDVRVEVAADKVPVCV